MTNDQMLSEITPEILEAARAIARAQNALIKRLVQINRENPKEFARMFCAAVKADPALLRAALEPKAVH